MPTSSTASTTSTRSGLLAIAHSSRQASRRTCSARARTTHDRAGSSARGAWSTRLSGRSSPTAADSGHLVDRGNLRTSLQSIMRHNHRRDFYDHVNDKRAYVMGDEAGLLMASYPRGTIDRPFTYAHEVMTGFEYTAAAGMIYEGLIADGLRCIEATRSRYDGSRRNPFDEAECGHHYARAMAAWGTSLALTGFDWSAPDLRMSFAAVTAPTRWWWSNGSAWGTVRLAPAGSATRVALRAGSGSIDLASFALTGRGARTASFDPLLRIAEGDTARFTVRR
ncbi:MAG: GH116 family glycosyl hydrolase [Acidimicrobiia bacterium]|nr:GH116 family glycosyl hydrolase [Acidimicrobiia bacterium]